MAKKFTRRTLQGPERTALILWLNDHVDEVRNKPIDAIERLLKRERVKFACRDTLRTQLRDMNIDFLHAGGRARGAKNVGATHQRLRRIAGIVRRLASAMGYEDTDDLEYLSALAGGKTYELDNDQETES